MLFGLGEDMTPIDALALPVGPRQPYPDITVLRITDRPPSDNIIMYAKVQYTFIFIF